MEPARSLAGIAGLPAFRAAIALHLLLGAALSFFPLFDTLGFERAFATGLLAAFTSPWVAIGALRDARGRTPSSFGRIAGLALLANAVTLTPAPLAGAIVEVVRRPCEPEAGVLFLLLLPGGGIMLGTALGLFAGALERRRWQGPALLAIVLLWSFGSAVVRLYAEPQIFVYSEPFGFWPGSIYDEELEVRSSLWAFRGYTAILSFFVFAIAAAFFDRDRAQLRLTRPRPLALASAALLGASAIWAHETGERAGWDLDRRSIERALSRTIVTEHFVIHADPRVRPEEMELLGKDHEFHFAALSRFFRRAPERPIHSFVYRGAAEKAELMGAGGTQIARPWATEIHLNGSRFPHPILKHELAHVFAAEIAAGPFKVPATLGVLVNVGVVEGIATAADWPVQELTVHGWAKAMRQLGLAADLRTSLDALGFWSVSSARAYTLAGSFIRWLVDTYGMDRFAALYRSNDFALAYDKSLDDLVGDWERFIDETAIETRHLLVAQHRFSQPGIFQKVCAHRAANLAERGYGRLAAGDLDGGRTDLEALLELRRNDPGPLIALAHAHRKADRIEDASRFLSRARDLDGATEKSRAEIVEAGAGIAWKAGDHARAREGYERVLSLHLSTPSDRLQAARLLALDRPEELAALLSRYLLGELSFELALARLARARSEHPEDALVRYLYGRALEEARAHEEALAEMSAAVALGLPDAALTHEAELSRGRLLLLTERPKEAEMVFTAGARAAPDDARRAEAEEWTLRARFHAGEGIGVDTTEFGR